MLTAFNIDESPDTRQLPRAYLHPYFYIRTDVTHIDLCMTLLFHSNHANMLPMTPDSYNIFVNVVATVMINRDTRLINPSYVPVHRKFHDSA
jgi:hypothetical protein